LTMVVGVAIAVLPARLACGQGSGAVSAGDQALEHEPLDPAPARDSAPLHRGVGRVEQPLVYERRRRQSR